MPQARRSGKTFRMLLTAIANVSQMDADNSEMNGVVVWVHNRDHARELFKKACDMIMMYCSSNDIQAVQYLNRIEFPNGTMLIFKSMTESRERRMGIDWMRYDEIFDHNVTDVPVVPERNPERPNEFLWKE